MNFGLKSGFTLLELIAATTISGLVALAVITSARIGIKAWEKEQQAVLQLRRVTNVQDILHFQLSNHILRNVVAELPNRRLPMTFFFAEEHRLVFLTSYSARERGRGGMVVADYFAEQQADRSWNLWLDEQVALDSQQLGEFVEGMVSTPEGLKPVLRPFERSAALPLASGLRECRFLYWRETPAPAQWVPGWSLLARQKMPAAVTVEMSPDETRWKGLAPVPVFVRIEMGGVGL